MLLGAKFFTLFLYGVWGYDFRKNLKLKEKENFFFIQFFMFIYFCFTFNFSSYYWYLDLKRHWEHSGPRPDTSSLVFSSVILVNFVSFSSDLSWHWSSHVWSVFCGWLIFAFLHRSLCTIVRTECFSRDFLLCEFKGLWIWESWG